MNRKEKVTVTDNKIMSACKIGMVKMLRYCSMRNKHCSTFKSWYIDAAAEKVFGDELKNRSFAIQAEESTDLIKKCYNVAFVRFVSRDEIQDNFFCCKELPESSKRIDIFNICP